MQQQLLLIAIVCWVNLLLTSCCVFPSSSLNALQSLYNSTNGEHWRWNSSSAGGVPWNFDSSTSPNPCSDHWQGIVCSYYNYNSLNSSYCDVQSLHLRNYSLQGTLPIDLYNLSSLVTLQISYNRHLIGAVPRTLFTEMKELQSLNLSHNHLSGELPTVLLKNISSHSFPNVTSVWPSLRRLHLLDLSDNCFVGKFPDSFYVLLNQLHTLNVTTNKFSGHIFNYIGATMPSLISLSMAENQFSGSLPISFCNLHNLTRLSLHNNLFSGNLPRLFGYLFNLRALDMHQNSFNGTLPASMGYLFQLEYLDLSSNKFTGPFLNESIRYLYSIMWFDVSHNFLTGEVPTAFNQLPILLVLFLQGNMFTGAIPPTIASCPNLLLFYVNDNLLTGQLPPFQPSINSILFQFWAQDNLLSGSIEESLFSLGQLSELYLYNNEFTGELPVLVSAKLESLMLFNNFLTGEVPYFSASSLEDVDLHHNYFTGNQSSESLQLLLNSSVLELWYLQSNLLSGALLPPAVMLQRPSQFLLDIRMDDNLFSGTMPLDMFTISSKLQYLNISSNLVLGPFPTLTSIATILPLLSLDISHNAFTGLLVNHYCTTCLGNLRELLLHSNKFSGDLKYLSNSRVLSIIDVSDNDFTGTIPPQIFQNRLFSTFAAVKNCLKGTLPETICDARKTMVVLALDGLHSASRCAQKIFPQLSNVDTYEMPSNGIYGTIPACLYTDMNQLQTLHLSGNGLQGSFPKSLFDTDATFDEHLSDLSLSHNQLTGSIPFIIQSRRWHNLDLSFNKFTGTLDSKMFTVTPSTINYRIYSQLGNSTSLSLNNNHLSGDIPSSITSMTDIDILSGNIFSCDSTTSSESLPHHDPHVDSYQCGSNNVNSAIYLWIGLFVVGLVIFAWSRCWVEFAMFDASTLGEFEHIIHLEKTFSQCRKWSIAIAVTIVIIFIPAYSLLSVDYGTYTHDYAWKISAALLTGETPSYVLFCLLTGFLFIIQFRGCIFFPGNIYNIQRSASASLVSTASSGSSPSAMLLTTLAVIFIVNAGLILAINMSFVYAMSTDSLSKQRKQGISFLVSLLKIIFNRLALNKLMPWVKSCYTQYDDSVQSPVAQRSSSTVRQQVISYFIWMQLFNNIVAPCLAIAFFSPDCFYYTMVPNDNIAASFVIMGCSGYTMSENLGFQCVRTGNPLTTSFPPQFSYSYQCSSTLLINFADVFVYRFILESMFLPAIILVIYWWKEYHGQQDRSNSWFNLIEVDIDQKLPILLRPSLKKLCQVWEDNHTILPAAELTKDPFDYLQPEKIQAYLDSRVLCLVRDMSIIASFGVVFPPLAVIGCPAIWSATMFSQFEINRFMMLSQHESSNGLLGRHAKWLNDASCGFEILMLRSLPSILIVISMFWSFFLFDTLGSKCGATKALWILIVMAVLPVLVEIANCSIKWEFEDSRDTATIEMKNIDRPTDEQNTSI